MPDAELPESQVTCELLVKVLVLRIHQHSSSGGQAYKLWHKCEAESAATLSVSSAAVLCFGCPCTDRRGYVSTRSVRFESNLLCDQAVSSTRECLPASAPAPQSSPRPSYKKVFWTFSVSQTLLVANAAGAIGSVCAE